MKPTKYLDDYRQMVRDDFTHFDTIPTRWGDADAYGHVNNVVYASYYETARVSYFADLLDMEFVGNSTRGLILADLKLAYLQQLNHPAEMEIGSRISRMGNTSLDMDAAIFVKGEQEPVSCCRAVLVWFDYVANRAQAIPKDARETVMVYERVKPV